MVITGSQKFDILAECATDEDCLPISECQEYKHVLTHAFDKLRKLRVCGVYLKTDEVCCKIPLPSATIQTTSPVQLKRASLLEHPNIKKINHKFCGRSETFRIMGGHKAFVGQFPWVVLIRYKSTDEEAKLTFGCGGSLISKKHILTAAHCVITEKHEL